MSSTPKGEATRRRIMKTALACFRMQGFAKTTMRDIAAASEMSLGAAYHYFGSKDALVAEYYAWTQHEHERRLENQAFATGGVRDRLHGVLTTKLDLLRRDRRVLAALFAPLGDPDHPLSLFGADTAPVRERSIATFRSVFADSGLSGEQCELAGYVAWLVHLGILLVFVHDRSKGQSRTRTLAAAAADLFGVLVPLAGTPMVRPLLDRGLALARELGVPGVHS